MESVYLLRFNFVTSQKVFPCIYLALDSCYFLVVTVIFIQVCMLVRDHD